MYCRKKLQAHRSETIETYSSLGFAEAAAARSAAPVSPCSESETMLRPSRLAKELAWPRGKDDDGTGRRQEAEPKQSCERHRRRRGDSFYCAVRASNGPCGIGRGWVSYLTKGRKCGTMYVAMTWRQVTALALETLVKFENKNSPDHWVTKRSQGTHTYSGDFLIILY